MTGQLRQPILVLLFVCAAFTCVASAAVCALALAGHIAYETPFILKLVVRIVAFGGVAVAVGIALKRTRSDAGERPTPPSSDARWSLALIPCVIAALIAFPRLGATPHVEPDEWHHLDVARNLAVHGLYASGNQEDGFILFDDYDSVGPPVILPVAAAMRLGGPDLESARVVMALFFVVFAGVTFAFVAPVFGGWAAVASSVLALGAWGSAYLGRALYGEVPALMFLLLALIAGRAAIQRSHPWRWGVVAGAMFGLAILSKYYLLMAVWPLMGAFVLDRVTARQIRWPHIAGPAIGSVAILASWSAVQTFAERNVSDAAGGQLSMYQHNILFGIEGVENTIGFLAARPASTLALIAGLLFGTWLTRRHIADPTVAALWLFAAFQWYWWIFFNTGNLPRYSWYGWATTAVLLGPLLRMLVESLRAPLTDQRLSRPLAVACCAALVVPAAARTVQETLRAYRSDEMESTRALARYIASRPDEDRIATAFWPLERSIQFLSGRTVARLGDMDTPNEYDVVLVNADSNVQWIHGRPAKRFGPYAAITVHD